jgi:hypothetical protein
MSEQKNQTALILKEWVYDDEGKPVKDLIKTSFLEFYFAKQTCAKIA